MIANRCVLQTLNISHKQIVNCTTQFKRNQITLPWTASKKLSPSREKSSKWLFWLLASGACLSWSKVAKTGEAQSEKETKSLNDVISKTSGAPAGGKSGLERETIVLKIGGSFLIKGNSAPDVSQIQEMAETVKELERQGYNVVVVVGGGITARQYVEAAAQFKASNGVMDHLGILVSRLNARVFIEAINCESLALSEPPENLQAVRAGLQTRPIVVLGGFQPGQSTTAVAALCAEYVKSKILIFGTDVDAVYSADPRKDANAKKYSEISCSQLRDLIITSENISPGQYRIMDVVALTIIERSKLSSQIIKGTKENILNVVMKGECAGTKIK